MKAGIITQARMTSERLPGKVLLNLAEGTVLSHHINRLRKSDLPIHLALADSEKDNELWGWAQHANLDYAVGSTDDVLSRFYEAAKKFELDVIVRVTSDCPLIDGRIIRQAVDQYLKWNDKQVYYSNCLNRTFPRGFDFEVFSMESLEEANRSAVTRHQREHVTPYLQENCKIKHFLRPEPSPNFRLTLDEPLDYELMSKLFNDFDVSNKSADEIIEILESNPNLARINASVEQKK